MAMPRRARMKLVTTDLGNGFMDWNVSTWGYWNLTGRSTIGDSPFDVEVTYECDPERFPGLVFRAPTPDEEWDRTQFVRVYPPVIDQAQSNQGGAEIGGKISLLSLQNWRTMVESLGQEIATETCYIRALLRIPFKIQYVKEKVWGMLLRRIRDK
eukprot:scaffold13187_cov60-Cylindrotheca_fusiformis.AAC.1